MLGPPADQPQFGEPQNEKQRGGALRSRRAWPTVRCRSPAFEVLPGGYQETLHVDVRQPAEQEPAELVPLLGLAKQTAARSRPAACARPSCTPRSSATAAVVRDSPRR